MHIAPYTDQQSVIRGCKSVLDGGCLSEDMLNTHGLYPGFSEQLRVLRMPGSQLFLQRFEVTDKKLLTQLFQSLCLRGMRWNVMLEVLASESFDGYPLVQQVCTQITQLSTPPRGRNESSTASNTLHVNSPLKALRNMLSTPDPCASTTNEPQLTNVARRVSKTKRKAARERAQRGRSAPGASREHRDPFNMFNTNVQRRRPKRSSKFHAASSSFEAFFRGFHVARVCYQNAYQTAVIETRVRRMTRKACRPPPCRPPCRPCTYLHVTHLHVALHVARTPSSPTPCRLPPCCP